MSHKINLLARFLALLEMTYLPILQNSIMILHIHKFGIFLLSGIAGINHSLNLIIEYDKNNHFFNIYGI